MSKAAIKTRDVGTITLGHYTLTATGLDVRGRSSYEEHVDVGEFIQRSHKASGWWLADWLRYGDSRADWQDRLDQAVNATGLQRHTLENVRAIGKIDKSCRRENVPFALHDAVTKLTPDEQVTWLAKAETEGWTLHELRKHVRAAARTKIIEGQAVLTGQYRVIYADPPWLYGDSGATADGSLGKAARHFPGLTIDDLCTLPVAAHALPDSVLFLWTTAPMLYENPGPREVIAAWGFTPKTNLVWDKVLGNWGHYVRVHHEHLIIATRGSCLPDVPTPMPDSVQTIRRDPEHSQKPEEFRAIIDRLYPSGPKLELFARTRTPGWSCFGNDAKLWSEEAAEQDRRTALGRR